MIHRIGNCKWIIIDKFIFCLEVTLMITKLPRYHSYSIFKNGSLTNYFDFYSWKGRITTHPHLDYLLWKALLILIMPTITILIDENKKLIFNILALKICMTNTYLCTTTITCDLSMVFLVEFLYVPHHPINVSTLVSPYILSLYV